MKAINVKDALVSARKNCLGMTEAIYQFADFLASRLNDTVTPEGLVMAIALAISDISTDQHDSEYIKQNKRDVLDNAEFVLQIVNVMTDKEYSTTVRAVCEQVFPDWSPMVRLVPDKKFVFVPEERIWSWTAVMWWVGAMQLHTTMITLSSGEKIPTLRNKNLTQEQINEFALLLFWAIDDDMQRNGFSELGIGNECLFLGDRCHLYNVCERMGIEIEWLFPTVFMSIHKDKIEIKNNHKFTTIWKAE